MFSDKNFAQVLTTIENLNTQSYFELQNWRLAERSEIDRLWAYGPDAIEEFFLPSGLRNDLPVWRGRYDELYQGMPKYHSLMSTDLTGRTYGPGFGAFDDSIARPELGAWVAAIPEPATLLLLTLGAIPIVTKRRK